MIVTIILSVDAKLVMGVVGWCNIGSLGKDQQEAGVQNLTVKTVTFTGTQNGSED